MAIVKHNYIRQDKHALAKAKKFIRYIENRRGKDEERQSRTLFDSGGALTRQDAYQMIDESEQGMVFFRLVVSPDPAKEDARKDLPLRDIAEYTMLRFAEHTQRDLQWVGVVHEDHTSHRHIHILTRINWKLPAQVFKELPQVLREAATEACVQQRRELDLKVERWSGKTREEGEWERER